jgi:hypothetical protein
MGRHDVCILCVFVIKSSKLPIRGQAPFVIFEFSDISEHGHFFNEVLQRTSVHRERRIASERLNAGLLSFFKFCDPNVDYFLKFRPH